jgi:enamine deaminase RidA (YjgF/YER057c/UK114 family)
MTVEYLNPSGLHSPVDNMYSHISRAAGRYSYRIGGQVPVAEDGKNVCVGDMAGQLRVCYEMVTLALESVRLTWRDVTHIYTFTTDMETYLAEEQAVARAFFADTPPPSTLVQVAKLVDPEWMVEVQVDAVADH